MRPRPGGLVAAGSAAFAAGLGALAILRHRAFWSGRFDIGNVTQAVWSAAHGHLFSTTGLLGQFSRLGVHFEPVLALFAPLWWLWPDPSLLLVVQATAVAAGAPAVYLLGRRHLGSDWAAAGFALAYLLHPATQWLVLDDFHAVALAAPLLLWGFWFLDSDRILPFVVVAALACATKEQIGLVVAAMGLWYALRPGRRRVGIAIAAVSATAAILAVTIVVPHFAPGGSYRFEGRYRGVGGSPAGIVRTAFTDPGTVASAIGERRDASYLGDLLLPLLALPLLSPLTALTAAPEIGINLLSDTGSQTSVHYHYTAGALPGLMVAAVLGAARLRRRFAAARVPDGRAVVLSTLAASVLLGPLPLWRHVPFGSEAGVGRYAVGRHAAASARAVRLVPAAASVSATNTLGAHLSERASIFSFPQFGHADWVAVDTLRPSHLAMVGAKAEFAADLRRLRASGLFDEVFSEDGVLVFRRRPVRAGSSEAGGTP